MLEESIFGEENDGHLSPCWVCDGDGAWQFLFSKVFGKLVFFSFLFLFFLFGGYGVYLVFSFVCSFFFVFLFLEIFLGKRMSAKWG